MYIHTYEYDSHCLAADRVTSTFIKSHIKVSQKCFQMYFLAQILTFRSRVVNPDRYSLHFNTLAGRSLCVSAVGSPRDHCLCETNAAHLYLLLTHSKAFLMGFV